MKKRFIVGPSGGFCAAAAKRSRLENSGRISTLLVGVCPVGKGREREHSALEFVSGFVKVLFDGKKRGHGALGV